MNLQAQIHQAVRRVLRDGALQIQRAVKENLNRTATPRDGRSGSKPPSPPGKRTGELGRHVQVDFSGLDDQRAPWARVGMAKLKYAAIQEYGGTITPVNSKYLPIPCNARARALRRKAGTSLRNLASTKFHVVESHGQKYLIETLPAQSKRDPAVFKLSKSLTLPARPYFAPAVRKLVPDIMRKLKATIVGVLGGKR